MREGVRGVRDEQSMTKVVEQQCTDKTVTRRQERERTRIIQKSRT